MVVGARSVGSPAEGLLQSGLGPRFGVELDWAAVGLEVLDVWIRWVWELEVANVTTATTKVDELGPTQLLYLVHIMTYILT